MNRDTVLKSITALFIILNVLVLVGGFVLVNNIFKTKALNTDKTDYYLKKEDDILSRLNSIQNSNVHVFANLKTVQEETLILQNQVKEYSQQMGKSQDNISNLQNELLSANQQTVQLQSQIASVKNKINQQNAATVHRTVVRRTTRSS